MVPEDVFVRFKVGTVMKDPDLLLIVDERPKVRISFDRDEFQILWPVVVNRDSDDLIRRLILQEVE
jgi:hypothetical protein